jgi:hypothetical protein
MHADGDDLTGIVAARTSGSGKKRDFVGACMMEWAMGELSEMMMGWDWECSQEMVWIEIGEGGEGSVKLHDKGCLCVWRWWWLKSKRNFHGMFVYQRAAGGSNSDSQIRTP